MRNLYLTPENPYFLAIKAGIVAFVALTLDMLTGNEDHISSVFVAVLSVSPTVLMGFRRALSQLSGSLIGGAWGTLMPFMGLEPIYGIPTAVALSVFTVFILGMPMGYPVAAFTALFVQALPDMASTATFQMRIHAVIIAMVSAFAVNTVISAAWYKQIFNRRLKKACRKLQQLLKIAADKGPEHTGMGFAYMYQLQEEMTMALEELQLRRSKKTHQWLTEYKEQIDLYIQLLHLLADLRYLRDENNLSGQELQNWLTCVARHPIDNEPALPEVYRSTADRIKKTMSHIHCLSGGL